MIRRFSTLLLAVLLLLSTAGAEFYTANPDVYYHADANCVAGSTYEISEAAARQFEKIPCPVCVNHHARKGEIVEIPLPENRSFYLSDVDLRDGNLLACGYDIADEPGYSDDAPIYPYLALFATDGSEISALENRVEGNRPMKACLLSDGRIALTLKNRLQSMSCVVLVDNMRIVENAGYGMSFPVLQSVDDGFAICCDPEGDDTWRVVRFDGSGRQLWMTEPFPEKSHADALFVTEDGCMILGHEDVHGEFSTAVIAVVDANGNILSGPENHREVWRKIVANLRRMEGPALVNGESIFTRCDNDFSIIPYGDGWLAALRTNGPYARIVRLNGDGTLAGEWFEETGEITYQRMLRLMDDGEICLFVHGTTAEQTTRTDADGIYYEHKSQTILKKLEVKA